jgi:hypothetical protein
MWALVQIPYPFDGGLGIFFKKAFFKYCMLLEAKMTVVKNNVHVRQFC